MGGLLHKKQVPRQPGGLGVIPVGDSVREFVGHRVQHRRHYGVDIRQGDVWTGGIGADFGDLRAQTGHQTAGDKGQMLGAPGVDGFSLGLEVAFDPLGQPGLVLQGELHHAGGFFDGRRGLEPAVGLVFHRVVDQDQTEVFRQIVQNGQDLLPLRLRPGEHVVVVDLHQGPVGKDGQRVHRLLQQGNGHILSLIAAVVEVPHARVGDGFADLAQIVFQQIPFRPVENIKVFQCAGRQVLSQGVVLGGVVFLLCHNEKSFFTIW